MTGDLEPDMAEARQLVEKVPRLPRGVRLRYDTVRDHWMLLAPERAYKIDETAAAILQLVDGRRDLAEIISAIAEKYAEDRTVIAGDVEEMLLGLAAKGVLNL